MTISARSPAPRRGEVWRVRLDPTEGSEIQKTRPVVVVSSDALGRIPLRIVVSLTGWKEPFAFNPWMPRVEPSRENGLSKASAVNGLQVRCVSTARFADRVGRLSEGELAAAVASVGLCIEHP
ncbi:MAG TPA: type II toxin-antitoxin system PemK/MazF family toxin [Planctomycetota bacterium]|jgi:mRNA interferase MazF|nr:type II toxin-antitoxin system PemK/MazF family toxin [Planctomycetota bacterium]